jgi:hypothetical protein
MKPTILLILTAAFAHAGVILNAPDPKSGFFDGYSDYFSYDGTGKLAGVSSTTLPESNGLTAQKVYGSAFLASGDYDPYIVMVAWGTASGSFAVDTLVAVNFKFSLSPGVPEFLPFDVQGSLQTDNGYFYTEYIDSINWGTQGTTGNLKKSFTWIIPAGTTVTGWSVGLSAGNYGASSPTSWDMTLTIPANSVELVAVPYGDAFVPATPPSADVPEPATIAFTAAGLALLIARRLRHPV